MTSLSGNEFELEVEDALEHLWDFAYLGRRPLADLNCVKQRLRMNGKLSHVDKGRAVSQVLRDAIGNLKPTDDQPDFVEEKQYYAILTKKYIERTESIKIADALSIGERTLYRHRAKAVQIVAQILRDWEGSGELQ